MAHEPESRILVAAAGSTIAVGTVAYMFLEHWTPVQALYFCVVTLATVGYGDLHPTTELGQLFTIGYILTGVGILATFISELAKHRPAVVAGQARIAAAESKKSGKRQTDEHARWD